MIYTEAQKTIQRFSKILVSGPQRSGTTIAAKIISKDFDLQYIDETAVRTYDEDRALRIITGMHDFVLQCPGLCAWLHALGEPDVLIVFMMRDIMDTIASEKRINWLWDKQEYKQYRRAFGNVPGYQEYRPISSHKRIIWHDRQRGIVENFVELDYESLADHPLWMPKEKRKDFKPKQTAE